MTTVVTRDVPGSLEAQPLGLQGIDVHEAILHLVGTQRHLSKHAIAWTSDVADFRGYLRTHIAHALNDPQLRAAVTHNAQPDTAVGLSYALARGEVDFVESSCRLAELLHKTIDGDRRVKEGVFAVVTCSDPADKQRFVALLKLDLGPAFQEEWRPADEYVAVRALSGTLPATGDHLQKAAFVSAVDTTERQYLQVIDRQSTGVPAKFFVESFLHAVMRFDDATLTNRLYQALRAARRALVSADPEHQLAAFDHTVDGIFAQQGVVLDDAIRQLPTDEQKAINHEVSKAHLDRAFTFDPAALHELTRIKRFLGDHDLAVEVDADYACDVIEEGPPDTTGKRTIVLHTETWIPQ